MDKPSPSRAEAEVVDAHCHAASHRFIPRSFIDGSVRNLVAMHEALGLPGQREQLVERYLASLEDHTCDGLVEEMDQAGISWTVLLLPDFTYCLRDCALTIEEMYEQHHAILQRHPGRFQVMGGIDPRWGKDALALFERGLTGYGFRGLKLYPPCGYRADDRSLFPFYELCAAHRVPVLLHTGPTSPALSFEYARPCYLDEAARQFPTVPFILAHAATAYPEECAALCAYRPNVYLDVSGFQSVAQNESATGLLYILRAGIAHKVLFGMDWPVFQEDGSQREHLELFLGVAREELAARQLRLVLRDNAARLFGEPRRPQG